MQEPGPKSIPATKLLDGEIIAILNDMVDIYTNMYFKTQAAKIKSGEKASTMFAYARYITALRRAKQALEQQKGANNAT